jgi:uncharacterized protein YjiK
MKRQVYHSIALVILSFITVKHIQKAGIDHYRFFQTLSFQQSGFYAFNSPSSIHTLPFELREVSGLTDYMGQQIACIQDEAGIIFIYDLTKDSIVNQYQFRQSGDFEGLTRVQSTFFALRSDATLFEISSPYDSVHVRSQSLQLPSWDHEGLCFDERLNRLLIAPKSKQGKGHELKDIRAIYAYDLVSRSLIETPVLTISLNEIESFAKSHQLPLPMRSGRNGQDSLSALKFMPSSIAVHPITDEIYIISAVDHTLVVYSKAGELINYVKLNPAVFNKPEGITFLEDGTLLVTNEGQMGTPSLLSFNWKTTTNRSRDPKN